MRRLHWVVTRPLGRLVGRYGLRTRIHPDDWDPVPLSPVESRPADRADAAADRARRPDPYFPLDHPRMLAARPIRRAAELWLEPGMGHAENAADDDCCGRIGGLARLSGRAPSARHDGRASTAD